MNLDDMVIRVHPGDGLVGRFRGVALILMAASAAQEMTADQLVILAETAGEQGPTPGRRLARQIAGLLSVTELDETPSFCVLAQADDGLALILHGQMDADISTPDGEEHLSGRHIATWVDRIVDRPIERLVVGPAGHLLKPPNPRSRLGLGMVAGGGLSLVGIGAEEGPRAVLEPDKDATLVDESPPARVAVGVEPEPVVAASFESVALHVHEPAEVRPPLPTAEEAPQAGAQEPRGPQVQGAICSRRHFNDPTAPFCGVCGISMVQRTLNLVEGPRPPLGVVVFDDGATFTVDMDYVLGREPELDPKVQSGAARPLTVDDPGRSISRVHAGLNLDGWNVKVVDRGSANGTYIAGPGEEDWERLALNQPTTIKPGTHVRVGERVFLFDSHQGRR